jgi:excisionase family DNA binding protein
MELLRVVQVAERLNIARATVYRLIERGEITVVRPSLGTVRIDARELERFVAERTEPQRHVGGEAA